jgi:sodium/hydrogen exchanger 3
MDDNDSNLVWKATTKNSNSAFAYQSLQRWNEGESFAFLVVLATLVLAFVAAFVIRQTRFKYLPESGAALLIGFVVGGGIRLVSDVQQLQRVVQFDRETFFLFLLPPIIFSGGLNTKRRDFADNIVGALLLAFVGTFLSTFIIGGLIYAAVASKVIGETISFVECLVFGSLISATDTVTVLSLFSTLGVHSTLYSNVFGESALNDAVAIALYGAVIQFDTKAVTWAAVGASALQFFVVFAGSLAIGIGVALLAAILFKYANMERHSVLEAALVIAYSMCSYMIAEGLALSGIVAVFFCGLGMAHYTLLNLSPQSQSRVVQVFEVVSFVCETFLFVYLGMAVFSFRQTFNANLIVTAALACLIGRLPVFPLIVIANRLSGVHAVRLTLADMTVVWFAGLRGAMAFALALGQETEHGELLLTTTLVLVLLTVLGMGSAMAPLVASLKVRLDNDSGLRRTHEEQAIVDAHNASGVLLTIDRRFLKPWFTRVAAPGLQAHDH